MPDDNNSQDQAETGEVVGTDTESVPAIVDADVDLVSLINSHVSHIDELKKQSKKLKDMLDSLYQNDSTYQTHDAAVKETVKVRNATKKQIEKLPQAADLVAKITDLKDQMKEYSDNLSDYLKQYASSTGSMTIESADGELRQIVYIAKLVKKS